MFDLTPAKLLVVLVVALIVLGPDKLPGLARQAGKALADFRRFRAHLEAEARETLGDLPEELAELRSLTRGSLSAVGALAEHVASATPARTTAQAGPPERSSGAPERVARAGSVGQASPPVDPGGALPVGLDDPAYN